MELLNIGIGLIVFGISAVCALWAARKIEQWFPLTKQYPLLSLFGKSTVGISMLAVISITLTIWRIRIGLVPQGADPNYNGSYLGFFVLLLLGNLALVAVVSWRLKKRKVK